MTNQIPMSLQLNGCPLKVAIEPRETLADLLRDHLGQTGTHIGCQQGHCGACTVLVDGNSVRACLMLAVQANGSFVETVEGLAPAEEPLHPLQQALRTYHALQCGFCTPGIEMTLIDLLRREKSPNEADIRAALAGHMCRCTGYQNMIEAVLSLVRAAQSAGEDQVPGQG